MDEIFAQIYPERSNAPEAFAEPIASTVWILISGLIDRSRVLCDLTTPWDDSTHLTE